MSDLSNVIEGESYFAKVYEAVADYNEKQKEGSGKYQWEINVAVDQEVYDAFKEAGEDQYANRVQTYNQYLVF